MKLYLTIVLLLVAFQGVNTAVLGSEAPRNTTSDDSNCLKQAQNVEPTFQSIKGFQSNKQDNNLIDSQCYSAQVEVVEGSSTNVDFGTLMTLEEASKSKSKSFSGGVNIWVVKLNYEQSQEKQKMKNAQVDSFSFITRVLYPKLVYTYDVEYLSDLGAKICEKYPKGFPKRCGDSVILNEQRQAYLRISIDLSANTEKSREEIKQKFSMSLSKASVTFATFAADLDRLSQTLGSTFTVAVSLSQIGGEPNRLSEAIPDSFKSCMGDKIDECKNLLAEIMKQAKSSFTQQTNIYNEDGSINQNNYRKGVFYDVQYQMIDQELGGCQNVSSAATNSTEIQEMQKRVAKQAQKMLDLNHILDDIAFFYNNMAIEKDIGLYQDKPGFFFNKNSPLIPETFKVRLEKVMKIVSEDVDTSEELLTQCINFPESCKEGLDKLMKLRSMDKENVALYHKNDESKNLYWYQFLRGEQKSEVLLVPDFDKLEFEKEKNEFLIHNYDLNVFMQNVYVERQPNKFSFTYQNLLDNNATVVSEEKYDSFNADFQYTLYKSAVGDGMIPLPNQLYNEKVSYEAYIMDEN